MADESPRPSATTRRTMLKAAAGLAAAAVLPRRLRAASLDDDGPVADGRRVVVIGAGAFGGWTALALQRRGAHVTLVDAWGAGHSRASSGDETRVIRAVYNGDATYIDMVLRAWSHWHAAESRWQRRVFMRTGALWMYEGADTEATSSAPLLAARGVTLDRLTPDEVARQWPQIRPDGLRVAHYEPDAGYLLARASCELVRDEFVRLGGTWRLAQARPGAVTSGRLSHVELTTDTGTAERLEADAFVFACGPWLGPLFPDVVGRGILPTRQDVVYVGLAAGDSRFDDTRFPVWINYGSRLLYGIPGNERRGFKVADDTPGIPFDPTRGDRRVSPSAVALARGLLARRFPALADAPIVETRVCQYEMSPIGDFLMDRHPGASNTWLLGGGSGHGFKMGPAVGETMAQQVLDGDAPAAKFSYAAFAAAKAKVGAGQRKHS